MTPFMAFIKLHIPTDTSLSDSSCFFSPLSGLPRKRSCSTGCARPSADVYADRRSYRFRSDYIYTGSHPSYPILRYKSYKLSNPYQPYSEPQNPAWRLMGPYTWGSKYPK